MAFLRSSRNYVWNINNVLGKGATGAVYSGVNKHTGYPVAVKSFNHASHMRPYEVQEREFEVLKKVNHQNIVRLIAIEEENESHHKVLIMELCTGGSLFNILDDPVNLYGLQEKEFTAVLKHLAAGMKHLRDNNIIHRDLKPGNIMKYIGEDGISIYKLTDFGAARVLEDDQPFMSLYGTEEYLHPDMYARAVLHKSAGKSFRANVDLWSIGVTLYHIATGSLPFKPYGGRKNKETMFKITTEKKSGIIAGFQEFENGEIVWSDRLPPTCLLSPALQELIVPLLAGIMECDSYRMWSFDEFFTTVTRILSHKVLYIFYVNQMEDLVVYLLPNEFTLNDLKRHLENKTSIPSKSILLLWNKEVVQDLTQISSSRENPILLINSDNTKLKLMPFHLSLSKIPEIHKTPTNCEADAQLSKSCASIAYAYRRVVSKCVAYYNLANETPSSVIALLYHNCAQLKEKFVAGSHVFRSLKHQLDTLRDTESYLKRLLNLSINNHDEKIMTQFEAMNRANALFKEILQYSNDCLSLLQIYDTIADNIKKLQDKPSESPLQPFEMEMEVANAKARYYSQKVRESWQFLHKDKTSRGLTMAEDQLHQLEKIKIDNNSGKLCNLVQNICFPSLVEITKKLEAWYSEAQVILKEFDAHFRNLSYFMNKCDQLEKTLEEVRNYQKATWQTAIRKLEARDESTGAHSNHHIASQNGPNHLDILKLVVQYEEERNRLYSLMEENESLVHEFDSLSWKSPQE